MADISKKPAILILLILLGIALFSARLGSNYGEHFDESYFVSGLEHSARNLTLLPQRYIYPGMYFNIGYLMLAPDILQLGFVSGNGAELAARQQELVTWIRSPDFLLAVRRAFITISALAIACVFLASRAWARSNAEALVAASLLALSWEVNYHSRHIAVDNMLMMFAILSVSCLLIAHRQQKRSPATMWVLIASVAAGLAAASKMLGFLLVIPIVMSVLLYQKQHPRPIGPMVVACLSTMVVLISFIAATPGVILEPATALEDWFREANVYGSGFEPAYTYHGGPLLSRIMKVTAYFSLDVFSHISALSAFFTLLIPIGLISAWKEDRKSCMVFLSFPVLYLSAVVALRLFVVRNLMVLVPFAAILSARGLICLYRSTTRLNRARFVILAPLALLLVINTSWLFASALTVDRVDLDTTMTRLKQYMDNRPGQTFVLSEGVYKELKKRHPALTAQKKALTSCADQSLLVLYNLEHAHGRWVANRKGFTEHIISSHEVNYDYYPTWHGINLDTRTVIIRVDRALEMHFNKDAFVLTTETEAPSEKDPLDN